MLDGLNEITAKVTPVIIFGPEFPKLKNMAAPIHMRHQNSDGSGLVACHTKTGIKNLVIRPSISLKGSELKKLIGQLKILIIANKNTRICKISFK